MSLYEQPIRELLSEMGLSDELEAREVEASMRLQYRVLDYLPGPVFVAEILLAYRMKRADPLCLTELADSFAL